MLNLLSVLQVDRFNPRYYIAAATDNMSLQKARVFEDCLADKVMFPIWCLPDLYKYFSEAFLIQEKSIIVKHFLFPLVAA